jgi:CspA family cold shock protein
MTIFYRIILSAILASTATVAISKLGSAAIFFNPTTFVILLATCLITAFISPAIQVQAGTGSVRRPSNADREQGTVKWFNVSKGYGFVTRPTGEDIFVHFRSITGKGRQMLRDGQPVEYTVTDGEKGPQAEDVEPLSSK